MEASRWSKLLQKSADVMLQSIKHRKNIFHCSKIFIDVLFMRQSLVKSLSLIGH